MGEGTAGVDGVSTESVRMWEWVRFVKKYGLRGYQFVSPTGDHSSPAVAGFYSGERWHQYLSLWFVDGCDFRNNL